MSTVSPVELDHCGELVMLPGSLFEFTSRFLPADQLQPLLALYALIHTISIIPDTVADDSVKWAKLKWWSEEFVADQAAPSRHPVLRALWLSGARAHLNNTLLARLISDAIMQIDAAPNSDENAMFERFAALGSTEISLELALDNAVIDHQNLKYLGAATRLYRLISGFAVPQRFESERIPLNLMAKYDVSANQLEKKPLPAGFTQIIVQLAEVGLQWYAKGMSGLMVSSASGVKSGSGTHIQLRWAMERRRLTVIYKDAGGFLDAGKHYGPADAWFAWRFLRRLR